MREDDDMPEGKPHDMYYEAQSNWCRNLCRFLCPLRGHAPEVDYPRGQFRPYKTFRLHPTPSCGIPFPVKTHRRQYSTLLFCALLFLGCSAASHDPPPESGLLRQHNEGYSLLYKLLDDESRVGQIFILKHADNSIRDLVQQIGSYATSQKKQMDLLRKADPELNFQISDLPAIEQKSRDLQQSDDTRLLLFSGNDTFQLELVYTQAQAMDYAVQLSKALSEHETDRDRGKFLDDLSRRCGEFHDLLMKHLTVKP